MLTNYIAIYLNGRPFNCAPDLSLKDFLEYLAFDINSVIIEYNRQIVPTVSLYSIMVKPDDKIEVLTIVGGG